MRSRLGTLQEVLIEEAHSERPGVLRGRTRHNLPVTVEGGIELLGTSAICRITQSSPYGLGGILTASEQAAVLA
jgi:tRNA A37 methylthiotransferase MiaB